MIFRVTSAAALTLCLSGLAQAQEGPPLPAPSNGSCSHTLPIVNNDDGSIDRSFVGRGHCFDYVGGRWTLGAVTAGCTDNGKASAEACPTQGVLLTCSQQTKLGLVVGRWYAAPTAKKDDHGQQHNAEILKGGCKAPWSPFGVATVTVSAPGTPPK